MTDHVTMAVLHGGVAVVVNSLISGCGSFINISRGFFLLLQDACREWDRGSGPSPPPHSQSLVRFLPAVPPAHLRRPPPSLLPSSSRQTARETARKAQRVRASAARVTWLHACMYLARHHLFLFAHVTKGLIFADEASAVKCLCARGVWVVTKQRSRF